MEEHIAQLRTLLTARRPPAGVSNVAELQEWLLPGAAHRWAGGVVGGAYSPAHPLLGDFDHLPAPRIPLDVLGFGSKFFFRRQRNISAELRWVVAASTPQAVLHSCPDQCHHRLFRRLTWTYVATCSPTPFM